MEIFFIGLLVFSLKRLENPQNRIFSKKVDFLKKCDFEDFQALLEKKLKVLWKKFPWQKMLKIIQKIHFLYLEVGKTTSRWIFWKNRKIKILHFWKENLNIFQERMCKRLKIFFFKCKVDVVSFHTHFQVSKNIYNWLF